MSGLKICGETVQTVFDLLGKKENDITFSIAFVLSRCPCFLIGLLNQVLPHDFLFSVPKIEIECQHPVDGGFTDIEIMQSDCFRLIFEAKVGFNLPSLGQLSKYAESLKDQTYSFSEILTLSDSLSAETKAALGAQVKGIPLRHLSFRDVINVAESAMPKSTGKEKMLLVELVKYLKEGTNMIDSHSNIVYVVALGSGESIQEHDFKRQYHCPLGHHFPKTPPNYLGFRHHGKLQYINHVEGYENYLNGDVLSFRFFLGPDIVPAKIVKLGQKDGRGFKVYCDIDLLLTCDTLKEALEKTKARHN